MKLDDLKQNWQQSISANSAPEDIAEVIKVLEQETTKIDKEIKRRDFLEISISLLLIPVWIYGLFSSAGLMQTIGLLVAIVTSLVIPYKLLKAKNITTSKSDSIRNFLLAEKQKLGQQKRLLETIVWWYIAPITTAVLLITLGSTVKDNGLPSINEPLMYYYGFLALLVVGIYFLNKRAAKKKFAPLLEKIELRLAKLDN